jgi:hypothetical protein
LYLLSGEATAVKVLWGLVDAIAYLDPNGRNDDNDREEAEQKRLCFHAA